MALEIKVKEMETATAVIALEGSVMRGPEGERIETVLNGLLDHGLRRIVFDMTGIKRIDSTGIGRFIYCLNKVQERGGKLWMGAGAFAFNYARPVFVILCRSAHEPAHRHLESRGQTTRPQAHRGVCASSRPPARAAYRARPNVFGQTRKAAKMFRAGLHAGVSANG